MRRRRKQYPVYENAPVAVPHDLSHHVVDESRAGELCGIKGERGSVYTILRDVLNIENGAEWVELIGGPSGHKEYRTPRPDRIVIKRSRRRGR
jgi:hypothetical protein